MQGRKTCEVHRPPFLQTCGSLAEIGKSPVQCADRIVVVVRPGSDQARKSCPAICLFEEKLDQGHRTGRIERVRGGPKLLGARRKELLDWWQLVRLDETLEEVGFDFPVLPAVRLDDPTDHPPRCLC